MLAEFSCKDEETFFRKFDEWTYGKLQRSVNLKNAQKYADTAFKEKIDKFLTRCEEAYQKAEQLKKIFVSENGVLKRYCGTGGEVVIPEGITSIDNLVFQDNINITKVVFPDSLEKVGDYAFAGCKNLVSVKLNFGLGSIGKYAFAMCSGLTEITIPNSVYEIWIGAFARCTRLTKITVPDSVQTLMISAFINCTSLSEVTVPLRFKSYLRSVFGGEKIGLFGPKIKVNFT